MCNRWPEFFEGENARFSMTRLLCFISIFPASYVVIITKSSDALGWYLGAYVLGYLGGKGTDAMMRNLPRPAAPVTINQPEKVNLNATP